MLGLVLGLAHRPLLVGYAGLFKVNDPAPSDALILWSDEPEAIAFYKNGLAPVVLMATDPPFPFPDLNPATVYREILTRRGVAEKDIRVVTSPVRILNDRQMVRLLADYTIAQGLRRVTVVASPEQTGRLRRDFRKALKGSNVDVRTGPVPSPWYDEANWYKCDEGLVAYFGATVDWIFDW